MRSQIAQVLKQTQLKNFVSSRQITTISDPRKSLDLGVRIKGNQYPEGTVQDSTFPALPLPNADMISYPFQNMSKWQHRTYTECSVTGRSYTYGQTMDGALRWAAALKKLLPNEENPVIAFIAPNSPEYITMIFGTFAAGAIFSPINPLYTPEEISHHLKDSGASLLVIDAILEPLADAAFKHMGKGLPVVVNGQSQHGRPNAQDLFSDPSAPMADPSNLDPSSIAFMPYSSGTTGRPKGVRLSHAAITNNMSTFMNEYISPAKYADDEYQEQMLGLLPFFHIYGVMATLLSSTFFGGKIVTMPKFDPTLFISTLKKHKMTTLQVVPLLLQFLADCPMITAEDLDQLHSLIVGGSPAPVNTAMTLKEKAPHALFQEGYGMTETLLTHITAQGAERIGYCGHLLPNLKAKIIDLNTGELLPENTAGELCIKTPSIMTGYHNNETATRETIDEEGWLHTGDIAIYTEEGHYAIVDRLKELIKVKGFQVSPTELEETLREHPGIFDVGVTSVPHPKYGEAPVAYIIKEDDDINESDVQQFMQQHLSKHKQLDGGIVFVDELPKNALGKLLRKELKEMAKDQ